MGSKVWKGILVGYAAGDSYRAYIPAIGRVYTSRDITIIEELPLTKQGENNNCLKELQPATLVARPRLQYASSSAPITGESALREERNSFETENKQSDHEPVDSTVEEAREAIQVEPLTTRSGRVVKPVVRFQDQSLLSFLTAESICGNTSECDLEVPNNARAAMMSSNKHDWSKSILKELESLEKNNVFQVVQKPNNRKVISCRWVFALKRNSSGEVIRHKARLVAKGFSQVKGVDYDEVFSPVVRFETLRFLLGHAAVHNLELKQVDVKTAFLYGDLNEEIYMSFPDLPKEVIDQASREGIMSDLCYAVRSHSNQYAIRLKKSLYGLKQAAKQWHTKLTSVFREIGFIQSDSDPCLFYRDDDPIRAFERATKVASESKMQSNRTYVLVYVDDIIIASNSTENCKLVTDKLQGQFDIGSLDEAHFFLGLKISRNRAKRTISISQEAYIDKILSRFNLLGSSASIPMRDDLLLEKATVDEQKEAQHQPFRELVGSLMYLATTSRPDIMFAVAKLARYYSCYGTEHWKAAKNVARYTSRTKYLALVYGHSDHSVVGYSDADWAGDKEKRKSTGGFVFKYAGAAFDWSSKLQSVVAASSVEAEFISLARCTREALWIRKLLCDFQYTKLHQDFEQATLVACKSPDESSNKKDSNTPIEIRCDNQGAISHTE